MEWIVVFAVLLATGFLILLAPLGVSVRYDGEGARVYLRIGLVRLKVYPLPDWGIIEKIKELLGRVKDEEKTEQEKEEIKEPQEKSDALSIGPISDFYPFITTVFDFLGDARKKLRVNCLQLKVILAGGDPADLAINYGRAWAAVGNLWPALETMFVVKKRDVEVECDFEGDKTTVLARIDLTMTICRISLLALRYLVRILKEFINFRKKRNGGKLL